MIYCNDCCGRDFEIRYQGDRKFAIRIGRIIIMKAVACNMLMDCIAGNIRLEGRDQSPELREP